MSSAASSAVRAVDVAARGLLARRERIVLAVSGGLDSMCLLESVAAALRAEGSRGRSAPGARRVSVATFDHRTGPHATRAAALVVMRARELHLPVLAGRRSPAHGDARSTLSEEALRDERWRFLRRAAGERDAVVATAHTRDDQVETVLMRALRGAGARGLAGLYADGGVDRPFLDLHRATLADYAGERVVRWEEDPTNASRRFLRNRVRLDLLPAFRRVQPDFDAQMLAVARKAAAWRGEIERLVAPMGSLDRAGILHVAVDDLARYDRESLRVLWPALAARAGATLDRRGTWRVATFTQRGQPGGTIQLSGGWEVVRQRDALELRRVQPGRNLAGAEAVQLGGETLLGPWRFRPVASAGSDPWQMALPADAMVIARAWRPGDRMSAGAAGPRRVKRFLSDAGIAGPDRAGWPVVLVESEIVWIPGVRRSDAATVRPGGPLKCYACERIDG